MERVSIDEIIAHCERNVERNEKAMSKERFETGDMSSWFMKEYWEHRQVAEYLKELKAYRDAEEQGLLFKTPFKIGQPIWFCGNELVNDYVIRQFIMTEEGVEAVKISKVIDGKEYWNTFYTEQWLVSVFPSKEEAEQKLAEIKGEG